MSNGGNDPNDDSCVFKYVRIEFAGVVLTPDNEVNSLMLSGMSRALEIHHVQLSYGGGDTMYSGISCPAPTLHKGRREGVVSRFIPADTSFAYCEELFWTYRLPADSVATIMKSALEIYRKGSWDTMALLEGCVSFPDKQTHYDTRHRRWVLRWPP